MERSSLKGSPRIGTRNQEVGQFGQRDGRRASCQKRSTCAGSLAWCPSCRSPRRPAHVCCPAAVWAASRRSNSSGSPASRRGTRQTRSRGASTKINRIAKLVPAGFEQQRHVQHDGLPSGSFDASCSICSPDQSGRLRDGSVAPGILNSAGRRARGANTILAQPRPVDLAVGTEDRLAPALARPLASLRRSSRPRGPAASADDHDAPRRRQLLGHQALAAGNSSQRCPSNVGSGSTMAAFLRHRCCIAQRGP